MADDAGYTIVHNAVPETCIRQVVDDMDRGLKVSKPGAKFTEYSVPNSAQAICIEFVKVGMTALGKFFAPNDGTPILKSVNVGTFHPTIPDPSKRGTGAKGQVYVTIALTDLTSETGWFDLLEGSHR